jgi:hypothetical protein
VRASGRASRPRYGSTVRLEAPLRTGLRFHDHPLGFAPPAQQLTEAKTVGIEFRNRLFVWHEIAPSPAQPPFPEFVYGPTVTVVYDDEGERDAAANDLGRFLSALVFHTELVIDSVSPFFLGGSGETDPYWPPTARELRTFAGTAIQRAPQRIEVEDADRVRLALAVYREGVSANPYLGFFAFWSVLDAVFEGNDRKVNEYVNREAAQSAGGIEEYVRRLIPGWTPPAGQTMADYLREHGRNAIAHVVRDRGHMPHIDPDDSATRLRLAAEGYWLRAVGRKAILERWPKPVRVIERA